MSGDDGMHEVMRTLRENSHRRAMEREARRQTAALERLTPAAEPLLDAARPVPQRADTAERIARIPGEVDYLRRNRLAVTRTALALRVGVDRGTLRSWIDLGYVPWPPD